MGMDPEARLAYGYDLGTFEDFKATPRSEYGGPELPWLDEDSTDLAAAAEPILLASVGFTEEWTAGNEGFFDRQCAAEEALGVDFDFAGTHDYPAFLLVAKGSQRSVEWADSMTLDPAEIATARPDWDVKLAAALTALGITPTQDGPKWLVFPFYG
jgi:hypothetical protein